MAPQMTDDRDLSPLVHHFRDVDQAANHRLTRISRTAMAAKMMALSGVAMAGLLATHVQAAPHAPQLSPAVQAHVIDYKPYVPVVPVQTQAKQKTLAVHLEQAYTFDYLDTAFQRHAETATGVMQTSAAQTSGRNMDVKLVNANLFDLSGVGAASQDTKIIHEVFKKASVVSSSEVGDGSGDVADPDFWKKNDAVFVQSAGNEGFAGGNPEKAEPIRQKFGPLQMADTALRVGASDTNGIKDYSSANAPDLVARNPFDDGFKAKYYRFGPQFFGELYLKKPYYVKKMVEASVEKEVYRTADSYLDKKEFDQRYRALTKDKMLMKELRQQANEEFSSGVFDAAQNAQEVANELKNELKDPMQTGIQGTSFTAPAVAGMIAAQRELHPQLTGADMTVAALLAASEHPISNPNGTLGTQPTPNDRGLVFDPVRSGYGELDRIAFAKKVGQMAALLKKEPESATRQVFTEKTVENLNETNRTIAVPVADQNVALRNVFILNLDEKSSVPKTVFITSPQGSRYEVPVSQIGTGDICSIAVRGSSKRAQEEAETGVCVMATTSAFLGSATKGDWKIDLNSPTVSLQSVKMNISAVKPGGIVDQMIDIHTGKAPVPAPQMKKQNTLSLN